MPQKGENIYERTDGRRKEYFKKEQKGKRYCYIYGQSCEEAKADFSQGKTEWGREHVQKEQRENNDTLSHVVDIWFESVQPFLKESSIQKYKNLLRLYILPSLGSCLLSEITNEKIYLFSLELLRYGGSKGKGLSTKTVSDSLSLLRNIQKYALTLNINVNFTNCCCPVKQKPKQLKVFSVQEQRNLCMYLKEHMTLSNLGILLCLFTGIRIGELCALRWGDISVVDQTLHIHQTMQRLQDEQDGNRTKICISSPKSNSSIRIIPLPEFLLKELQSVYQKPDTYFLTGDRVKFIEPRTMQNRFKSILRSCGMHPVNFHVLRHTFATRCVEAGFDVKCLSEILGHSSVNITLNRYVHPALETKRKNMRKLASLFTTE